MHSRFLRWSPLVSPALAILAVSLAAPSAKAQSGEITGSWHFTLFQTVVQPNGQFEALATFTQDGSFIGTAQQDEIPIGPAEGPAHGSWQRRASKFVVTFLSILRQPDASLFGFLKVNMTLTLDPQTGQLIGDWSAQPLDPDGNAIGSPIGGNLKAKRILVDTP